MNPKHFNIRLDRRNGDFWLVLEKPHQPMRKIRNITSEILGALCADLFETDGTKILQRDVKFDDGQIVRVELKDLGYDGVEPRQPLLAVEMPSSILCTAITG